VRWRSIEAFGDVAVFYAQENMEKVRLVLRNLFWLMNDESGGLGWNAPEAIGQILFRLPSLIDEYGRILSSFIHEEPFERGTHWALSRIAALNPPIFEHIIPDLIEALEDDDECIRGLAAHTLSVLHPDALSEHKIHQDGTSIQLYDIEAGNFFKTTVCALAGKPECLVANA
jgi:hypothetical protein